MDVFTKLFGEFLVFVYHCFDRIVIHGYLTALSRPELVVKGLGDTIAGRATRRSVATTKNPSPNLYLAETATRVPAETEARDLTSPIAFAQMLHGLAKRISSGPEIGVRPKPMAMA